MKRVHFVSHMHHFFCYPGPVPEALGTLTNLLELNLNTNMLTGTRQFSLYFA